MKGLLAILGKPSKDKGSSPSMMGDHMDEEEGPESSDDSRKEYKALIADAAKAGDWEAFADAVAGLVDCK